MLRDAEKLRTEAVTGKHTTNAGIQKGDKDAEKKQKMMRMIEEARKQDEGTK
jgi:hypothetical protein